MTSYRARLCLTCLIALLTWGGEPVGAKDAAGANPYSKLHVVRFLGGTFYGPGTMPDAPSPSGQLSGLKLNSRFSGEIDDPGSSMSEGAAVAVMSNGRPFNSNMEGGVIEVGRGAMRFHERVSLDGPGGGKGRFSLDSDLKWHLVVDLALDPGFPEGMVVINTLDITSGAVWVPQSLQTQSGLAGGTDRAGSLESGVPVVGYLGDDDGDGYLDGVIVGTTNMPLQHIFLPGAPTVQLRSFVTDIPVSALDATLLSVASALTYEDVFHRLLERPPLTPAAEKDLQLRLLAEVGERIGAGLRSVAREPRGRAYESRLNKARAGLTASQEMQRSEIVDVMLLRRNLDGVFGELRTLRGVLSRQSALRQ